MRRDSEKSRELILESAERFIRKHGAGTMTVDAIAREAGCAKGLIHYHFKTKGGVIKGAAERLAETRKRRWTEAFDAPSPTEAIDRTWKVLTTESTDGTLRAWFSLVGSKIALTEPTVKIIDGVFSAGVRDASLRMLAKNGLVSAVSTGEIGWYLGSVIHGMGVHLLCGTPPEELEGAYAAAWAGLLSLTRAATPSDDLSAVLGGADEAVGGAGQANPKGTRKAPRAKTP